MSEEPKQTEQVGAMMEEAMQYCGQRMAIGDSLGKPPIIHIARLAGTVRDLQRQLAERDVHLDWALHVIDGLAARLRGLGYVSRQLKAGERLSCHLICRDCHAEANQEHEAGCNLGYWETQAKQAAELALAPKGQPPAQSEHSSSSEEEQHGD